MLYQQAHCPFSLGRTWRSHPSATFYNVLRFQHHWWSWGCRGGVQEARSKLLVCSLNIRNGLLSLDGFLTCSFIFERLGWIMKTSGSLWTRVGFCTTQEQSWLQNVTKLMSRRTRWFPWQIVRFTNFITILFIKITVFILLTVQRVSWYNTNTIII
jgi:hypothetical protein